MTRSLIPEDGEHVDTPDTVAPRRSTPVSPRCPVPPPMKRDQRRACTPRLFRTARTLQVSVTEMCMNRSGLALCLSLSITMAGGVFLVAQTSDQVTLRDARGTTVGTATLKPNGTTGVAFELDLKGLPPGEHAVHLHQTPTCDPPSFESAGPHLNPAAKQHGLKNPAGPHAGDMNNVTVAADGTGRRQHPSDDGHGCGVAVLPWRGPCHPGQAGRHAGTPATHRSCGVIPAR